MCEMEELQNGEDGWVRKRGGSVGAQMPGNGGIQACLHDIGWMLPRAARLDCLSKRSCARLEMVCYLLLPSWEDHRAFDDDDDDL